MIAIMIATESKQVMVSRKQYFGRLRLTPRVPTSGHLVAPCFPTDPTSLELSEKCSKPRSGPPRPGALHASPCDASRRSLRGDPPADPTPAPTPPPAADAAKTADPAEAPKPLPGSSSVPSLDFSPGEEDARQGAKSSKDSLSSIERRRRILGRLSFAFMLVGAGAATWFMGRPWEEDELRAKRMVRVRMSCMHARADVSSSLRRKQRSRVGKGQNLASRVSLMCVLAALCSIDGH